MGSYELPVVPLDVHKGVVRGGKHALPGVAPHLAVRMDLPHIQIVQPREVRHHPPSRVIQALALLHESAREGPVSLGRLEVTLEQQQTQLTLLESEDDAVHSRVKLGMNAVIRFRRHWLLVSVQITLAKIKNKKCNYNTF